MDPLSDVLSLLRVGSALSARFEARGAWALRFPAYQHVIFGGALEGSFWLSVEGVADRLKLEPGDCYMLTNGLPHCIASDPELEPSDGRDIIDSFRDVDGVVRFGTGTETIISAGGRFTFDEDTSDLLVKLLPPVVHIPAASQGAGALRAALDLLGFETMAIQPGTAVVAASLANIVLVQILRAHLASSPQPTGWLRAIADPRIGAALTYLHRDLARPWKVEDLAAAVGMSRTAFAERFKALVGLPPLEYLIRWRMTVARDALKNSDKSLSAIAESVGYASDPAFNSAFKRATGHSPGRYRSENMASPQP